MGLACRLLHMLLWIVEYGIMPSIYLQGAPSHRLRHWISLRPFISQKRIVTMYTILYIYTHT